MTWDKITLSDKVVKAADEIKTHPLHKEYRREVESLVAQLRSSNTLGQLYMMQQRLLSAIQRAEDLQQQREDEIEGIKALRKEVVARGNKAGSPHKTRLWELRQQETQCSRDVEVYKQVRRELRSVGDGLLWKAVGYNRGYITGVSDAPGEGNRHLSDSEGLEAELNTVERCFQTETGLAILHDLTNIGRIGDLTLVSSNLNRQPQVLEVKRSSAQHNQRLSRQQERRQEMQQFVQGIPVASKDGYTKLLRVIDAPPEHHLEKYAEVLFEASSKGAAGVLIENYLGIVAFYTLHTRWDFLSEVEDEKVRSQLYKDMVQDVYEPIFGIVSNKNSLMATWDSMEKEFTLLENRTSGAPFSIYPFHPEIVAALICGYMRFFVYFDLNALARRFQDEGLQVNIEHELVGREQIFTLIRLSRPKTFKDGTRGEVSFTLEKPLMQQVLGEGMSFKSLVNNVVKPSFKGPVKEHSATALAYTNEGTIWDQMYLGPYMKLGTKSTDKFNSD